MAQSQEDLPYCVIGAGPAGLAAAKQLRDHELAFEVFEREDDVGGMWYYGHQSSVVYQSTRLISSKPLTQFRDFPIPESYPDYIHHRQALAYLRDYARSFHLYQHITFNTAVEELIPDGELWRVRLSSGIERRFRGVIIANGHLSEPITPAYPGRFSGEAMHAARYRTPDIFADRRVLVVGGGNTGCDIVVEAAQHARSVAHSVRSGYHYIPKFVFGVPSDQIGELALRVHMPLAFRRATMALLARMILGNPRRFGLEPPRHRLFEAHPLVNSQLIYYLGHGAIKPRPDIERFDGRRVVFVDGAADDFDLIVYATGYRPAFPFIDPALLNIKAGIPQLYLNVFHPQCDSLFVLGLIQPDSGAWGLFEAQARAVARFLYAIDHQPRRAAALRRQKAGPQPDLGNGIRYRSSPRHALEVEHFSYHARLRRLAGAVPFRLQLRALSRERRAQALSAQLAQGGSNG